MSDKKNLLNESQIRQFMKLASLTPLTPGFVKGLTERTAEEIEESHGRSPDEGAAGRGQPDQNSRNEGLDGPGEELEFAADDLEGGSPEEDAEADADIEVADAEMAPEVGAEEGRMISVDDFLSALESALEGVMGDEVEIDSDEMADEEPGIEDEEAADMDMGAADVDMDMAVDDEEMLEEDQGEKDKDDEAESARLGAISKDKGLKGSKKEKQKSRRDDALGDRGTRTDESTEANDDLVEAVTKRVAARILKSALAKK